MLKSMKKIRINVAIIMAMIMVCSLLVVPNNASAAGKMKLNKKSVTLTVGQKTTLKVKNAPKGQTIKWSTNKKKIATVSNKGKVTAKKKGTAKITAKVAGKKLTCKVKVKAKKSTTQPTTTQQQNPSNTTVKEIPTTPTNVTPSPTTPTTTPTSETTKPSNPSSGDDKKSDDQKTSDDDKKTDDSKTSDDDKKTDDQKTSDDEQKTDETGENDKSDDVTPAQMTNTADKDSDTVEALGKILGSMLESGATVSTDLDSEDYGWIDGKLTFLFWNDKNISGKISFAGLNDVESINIGGNSIDEIDVSENKHLDYLNCYNNELTKLDVSNNASLTDLDVSSNKLTSLDVSKNTELIYLSCESNNLSELDVSNNTKMESLSCYTNPLTKLDVSKNTELTSLACFSTDITELDLTNNTKLDFFLYDEDKVEVKGYDGGKEDPENPDNPGIEDPENPDNPGTEDPENPDNPGTEDPENPDNPGTENPENPDNPGTENPENPDNPGTEDPENPDDTTEPTIGVAKVDAAAGDTEVTVVVSVKNNPGILGMTLSIDYDDTAMILKSASNGDAVSDVLTLTPAKTFAKGCNFLWDGMEIKDSDIKDGDILVLKFDIPTGTKAGTYPITFTYKDGDITNNDLEPLTFNMNAGSVTIK